VPVGADAAGTASDIGFLGQAICGIFGERRDWIDDSDDG
jgi:hypothetical protein